MRPAPEDGSDTISAPATNGAGRKAYSFRTAKQALEYKEQERLPLASSCQGLTMTQSSFRRFSRSQSILAAAALARIPTCMR